jgi:hypothetical protein
VGQSPAIPELLYGPLTKSREEAEEPAIGFGSAGGLGRHSSCHNVLCIAVSACFAKVESDAGHHCYRDAVMTDEIK